MLSRGWNGEDMRKKEEEGEVVLEIENDGFATLKLNRPKVHNAFNDKVVAALHEKVAQIAREQENIRAVFVRSTGSSFSAGGDLNYMKEMAQSSKERNMKDAVALSQFLRDLSFLSCPTVALIQGTAMGGGVGLISVCDIGIAVESATFALSEVKLGLLPATISPYVIQRISPGYARRYFLTGEKFNAQQALKIGLVHEVVQDLQGLEDWKALFKKQFKANSPTGMAASKLLIRDVQYRPIDTELIKETALRLANQRSSEEGMEGVKAFLEKRIPKWAI